MKAAVFLLRLWPLLLALIAETAGEKYTVASGPLQVEIDSTQLEGVGHAKAIVFKTVAQATVFTVKPELSPLNSTDGASIKYTMTLYNKVVAHTQTDKVYSGILTMSIGLSSDVGDTNNAGINITTVFEDQSQDTYSHKESYSTFGGVNDILTLVNAITEVELDAAFTIITGKLKTQCEVSVWNNYKLIT